MTFGAAIHHAAQWLLMPLFGAALLPERRRFNRPVQSVRRIHLVEDANCCLLTSR